MEAITIPCCDGYDLHGHVWHPAADRPRAAVIINPATGVLARYYHRYARFLSGEGFAVLTYDYRGIGLSRPERMAGSGFRWRDWGELDFDAAVTWTRHSLPDADLMVVGHSIGGFLPGFAPASRHLHRMLTVGAQYAYWRDYAPGKRLGLVLKWHLAMPALTALLGYFPGRRLGWLEDLPAGVAHEWSFRRARMEASYPNRERPALLDRFAAVRAPILAVGMADDEFGTPQAIRRALGYYRGSQRRQVLLAPSDLGFNAIGHFDLFHDRHRDGFWRQSCAWLRDGLCPWSVSALLPPHAMVG
ncbi:alpha/beta hydrolase [Paramagnetospirillum marisnigri]|uniref:Alpha/beta hydrolase n=1 Tax=Paramagnetospirillum marisnigri TaxID=1285242 RepID=A0A178MCX8_9PROT|nr:alpha/beta fold hydrolase [Paramagnetospirillum marisnigri]OAN46661.1 alpha/beta hydrolase [Paramagnetospirillum marisnigri]